MSDLEQRLAALEAALAERDAIIAELRATNAKLEKRVAELEAKLGLNSSNSSLPPSSDRGKNPHRNAKKGIKRKKRKKRKKRRGSGSQRELLPPEQADEFHDHFPAACGGCGRRLPKSPDPEPRRHQVTDVPEVRPRTDEHRLHAVECRCGCVTRASLPDDVPVSAFGPRLTATVALLTGLYRLSKRNTRRILRELFAVDMPLGAVSKCEGRMGAALEGPHDELHRHVESEPVLYADETSWQQEHRTRWLWVACTYAVSFFLIQAKRCTNSAKHLLGSFEGTLVSDRLTSYDFWAGPRQTCWAHLQRAFQGLVDRGGTAATFGTPLLAYGTLQHRTLQRRMEPIRVEIERLLEQAAASPCVHTQGKARAILDHRDALWTFVDDPTVEPTNNEAERALRHAAVSGSLCVTPSSTRNLQGTVIATGPTRALAA